MFWPAMRELERVNKELWLVLSLFVVALVFNVVIASQQMVLGFYTLPTVLSAYLYGRRHATLTAVASVLLVIILIYSNLPVFAEMGSGQLGQGWLDIAVWGGTLIVTGYFMGTLYEHKDRQVKELRSTYHGILLILRHFKGMSRALLKLSGSLVHDYATISDDSPSPNRASRARRAATSAGLS